MSAQVDVWFSQRLWAVAGLYPADKIDGHWGPMSQGASNKFDAFYNDQIVQFGRFEPRTEMAIHTLLPAMQVLARKLMIAAKSLPSDFRARLGSGTRSCAEQNALYAQGRTAPGRKVTNAQCGQSNHNFGIAVDVDLFWRDHYLTGEGKSGLSGQAEEQAYIDLSKLVKASIPELEWGGDWHFVDRPHYQMKTGKGVSELRVLFEAGKAYV